MTSLLERRGMLLALLRDKTDRKMYLAGLSIPATLVTAVWKTALVIIAPSAFLIINVVYALGVAGAKGVAFTAHRPVHRREGIEDEGRRALRAYRLVGILITVFSCLYIISCLPLLLGGERSERYDPVVAVIIATVTFVELVMSIGGATVARRNRTLLVEAVRLASLAGSLVLLVLTQTAILSFAYDGDASTYNGLSGVLFGSCAAIMGVYMLVRAAWLNRRHLGCPDAAGVDASGLRARFDDSQTPG